MNKLIDSNHYYKELSIAILLPYFLLTIQTISSQFIGLEIAQIISKTAVGLYFVYVFVKYIRALFPSMIVDAMFFTSIFIMDSFLHINKVTNRDDIYIYFMSTCLPIFVYAKK